MYNGCKNAGHTSRHFPHLKVAGAVGAEFLCQKISKQESTIGDFSAVVTGLLLAFNAYRLK